MKIPSYKSLRTKMLLMLAVGMLCLFALLSIIGRSALSDGYKKLENDKTEIQINTVLAALNEQSEQLSGVFTEYAHWDDTYQYIVKPDAHYIEINFSDTAFRSLNIEAVFLVNAKDELIYKRGFDPHSGKAWLIPKQIEQAASKGGVLLDPAKKITSGLFWTPEGVCIVVARDIMPSSNIGKRLGTLIVIRKLDQHLIDKINKTIHAKFNIELFSSNKFAALAANKILVKPLNDSEVAGYTLLDDIGGTTKLVLRVVSDRKAFAQEKSSLKFLYWSLALIAVLLAVFSMFLDQLVLTRLALLSNDVKKISEPANIEKRVKELSGNDEMADLAHGINNMLGNLENSQRALEFEKERIQVTLAGIADAVITSDAAGHLLYMNAAAEQLSGINIEDAKGKSLQSLFRFIQEDKTYPVDGNWLIDSVSSLDEVTLERADGMMFVITKSASPLYAYDKTLFGYVTVLHDVTALRSLSKQLSYQARHDPLTKLANRYEFDHKTQEAINDAITGNRVHCLAYIDLDKFKVINDTCGHQAGDLLLQQLTQLLKTKIRSSDTLARLGGDEFALLLTGCDLHKAQEILKSLLNAVQEYSFVCEDKVFKVGVSIGLVEISSGQTLLLNEVVNCADAACYAAKKEGGNRIHLYTPNDNHTKELESQYDWVAKIYTALEKNQFVLYTQRMQGLYAGAEGHCELLIRMQGDNGKLYLPGNFLPAAEHYHLMPQIDRWVVSEALAIIARKGTEFDDLCAINLSGQSLSDEGFLQFIMDQIKQNAVDPRRLCFEITETAVISDLNTARQFMQALHHIGCRFSLDDFGSGLSSYAYLKNLQVDFLKIDGLFVKSMANNLIDRAMVESINKVGKVMGLQCIAEFAENDAIIDILKEIDVDYAQGYGVAMPEPFI